MYYCSNIEAVFVCECMCIFIYMRVCVKLTFLNVQVGKKIKQLFGALISSRWSQNVEMCHPGKLLI